MTKGTSITLASVLIMTVKRAYDGAPFRIVQNGNAVVKAPPVRR